MYRVLVNLCLIALYMSSNSAGGSPVDGESLFDSSDLLHFEMPSSCADKNFCFDKGDEYTFYPERSVEKLLKKLPLSPFDDRIGTELPSHNERDFDNECETEDKFSKQPIYYIRDESDQVRAVVQSPGRFEQIYSVRWCKRPGRISYDTTHFVKGSPSLKNHNITCVDTNIDFEFFVLSSEGKFQIARPKGGLPVCCKCVYHQIN